MSADLIASRRDQTLVLTLSNSSGNNRLEADMVSAAIEVLSTVESDESMRAVVLTGAANQFCGGERLFTPAGLRGSADHAAEAIDNLHTLIESIRDCPIPVIAAVDGMAADAGLALALACDLIVASRSAQFMISSVSAPHGGAAWFVAQALPHQLAAEMLLQGVAVSGERLHQMGVVNRLAPQGEVSEAALAWAEQLSAVPAATAEQVKALLRNARARSLGQHFLEERQQALASLQQQARREPG